MYYAIHVSTGKENSLIKLINERINHDFFNEVFAPQRVVSRKVDGNWVDHIINVFPGYIFVDTSFPKDFAGTLYRIPQYAKLLGREESSGSFVPLTENECITIDSLCGKAENRLLNKSAITFDNNRNVEILSGPLLGFKGKIKKIDLHKKIAIIELNFTNRFIEVHMPIEIIR